MRSALGRASLDAGRMSSKKDLWYASYIHPSIYTAELLLAPETTGRSPSFYTLEEVVRQVCKCNEVSSLGILRILAQKSGMKHGDEADMQSILSSL